MRPALKTPLAAALAASAPAGRPASGQPAKRAKLWELNRKHHCPVIGTCLTSEQLAKLARRLFVRVDARDEFATHTEAVGLAGHRNSVSEAIQKHLERKYRAQIVRFERARTDAEVLATWQEHLVQGDVAGALWAAITHRAASAETTQRVHADVHMLSHQLGAGQASDARRLARLEKECAAAGAALERQKKLQASSEAGLRLQLQKAQAEADRLRPAGEQMAQLQARLSAFESGSAMMEIGRKLVNLQAANEELRATVQRGWALEKTLKIAHHEALALASERDQLSAECAALERLLQAGEVFEAAETTEVVDTIAAANRATADCDRQCASCDPIVGARCVLYVGGRSSLLFQYRALAERLGIRLIHHDGGREESLARLPEMISGADAVICPTDCVSHSAYYQLKRQCKRSGKPCLLFRGAGVSSFAVALARLSAGQSSLAATPIHCV